MANEIVQTLDTTGLTCPLPILRLKQSLKQIVPGEQIRMIATDPGTQSDVPAFAAQTGHRLLESGRDGEFFYYIVEKA